MSDVGTPPITLPSPVDISFNHPPSPHVTDGFPKSQFSKQWRLLRQPRWRPLGAAQLILTDDNGDQHRLIFETFFNRNDALTLDVYSGPELRMLAASA
jgi:hypothetical protein